MLGDAGGVIAGGTVVACGTEGGGATNEPFAEAGSLSALASSNEICHICVSESDLPKPGIPVKRMPLKTFQ